MDTGNQTAQHALIKMTAEEFDKFRNLVYTGTHIFCPDSQKSLFERKIWGCLAALHVSSFQEYYTRITESQEGDQEFTRLIDAIAVHETAFFRISGHFTALETWVLPEFFQPPQTGTHRADIRIWSAGCSTGEEPYSIAIAFLETLAQRGLRASETRGLRILATDISPSIIAKAQAGMYSPAKVQKIPPPLLDKYFEYHHHQYYITAPVKRLVQFQVFNLINIETSPAPEFDLIFCRNLLIYFDRVAQKRLITGLTRVLTDGGYLFLGDAESLYPFPEATERFAFVESGDAIFYKKRGVQTQ